MTFRMKSIRMAGLLGLMVVFLAACMGGGETSNQGTEPDTEGSGGTNAVETAELRIGLPKDIGPLNIYTSDSAFDGVTELVLDKLFGPTPYVDHQEPWLAESAEQLDPFTWRVTIKDGIQWHDGEPFTVDDVKFTYEYYRDGPQNRHSHHVSEVPKINTIEIVDAKTVEFVCDYACPSLKTVTFADLPILQRI